MSRDRHRRTIFCLRYVDVDTKRIHFISQVDFLRNLTDFGTRHTVGLIRNTCTTVTDILLRSPGSLNVSRPFVGQLIGYICQYCGCHLRL